MNHITALLKALEFAAEKHKFQKRKGKDQTPYINHCIQVATLIAEVGKENDPNLLQAAILHDTIEDTATKPEEILSNFGQEVLDLVLEVTDNKSLPKQERKLLQIEKAPYKSKKAKLIKIADKICNIRDVTLYPPEDWSLERRKEYFDWAEKVVTGLRSTNEALEKLFDLCLEEGKRKLEEV